MKKDITFIRHAESYHNYNLKYGFDVDKEEMIDCGITQLGREQAKKLNNCFDILIISPLVRTKETFKYSNIKADKIIYSDLFREKKIDYCDFQKGEDIILEAEDKFTERINKAKEYLQNLDHKKIGVISHSDFIWAFSSYEIEGEKFGKWLDNCETYNIEL